MSIPSEQGQVWGAGRGGRGEILLVCFSVTNVNSVLSSGQSKAQAKRRGCRGQEGPLATETP